MAVNHTVTREPGTLADPLSDLITVHGRPLPAPQTLHYVLLNKPRGYLATRRDPGGRPVVTDLVGAPVRLYPVGRLDYDVEGALLLTNDGPLTHRLLHPRYQITRVYEATVRGRVTAGAAARWARGVMLEDGPARPTDVEILETDAGTSRLRLTFTEGRKHEVKRYCEALGHPVLQLRRVAFGPIRLGSLPAGRSRSLTPAEIRSLRASVVRDGGPRQGAPGPPTFGTPRETRDAPS